MRRVFAIGLAILVVMIATQGAVAQDAEQTATDKLLEILKDRQILSQDEYNDLANRMNEDRAVLNRRLGDLDRSISDYMSSNGSAIGANVTYTKGAGFQFASTDGLFALNLGGLFGFEYMGVDRERDEWGSDLRNSSFSKRDFNNLYLARARWWFFGHAFDPALTYHFEFEAGTSNMHDFFDGEYYFENGFRGAYYGIYDSGASSVYMLDAYVDWDVCGWTNLRMGRFKVPFGRQRLVHQSDLTFGNRAFDGAGLKSLPSFASSSPNLRYLEHIPRDRDEGIMFHGVNHADWLMDGFHYEYMLGAFDGQFASTGSWLMPAFRYVVYPFGYIPYVESDFAMTADPMFGVGFSWFYDQGPEHFEEHVNAMGLDFVGVWQGVYLQAEWQRGKWDERMMDASRVRNWYIQAGWQAMPAELELFARYSRIAWPHEDTDFGTSIPNVSQEWSVGAAYYWNMHNLKALFEVGRADTEWDEYVNQDPEDIEVWFLRIMFQLEW